MSSGITIYLIAGEPSGDALGAGVMRALRKLRPIGLDFQGIGGPLMEAEGLRSLFPYRELALMGFAEILPHLLQLLSRIGTTVDDIESRQPEILLTIDSPGFCKAVAKKLRRRGRLENTKFIHYVAPTVWAYKPGRAKKFARIFNHMLCLLPFEPPFFWREHLPSVFVGHAAVWDKPWVADGNSFRTRNNIAPETEILCMLPGSRMGEIQRHLPIFLAAIHLYAQERPNLCVVVPTKPDLAPLLEPLLQGLPFPVLLLPDESEKPHALAASHVALVKSGTVALEVAQAGVPMVVAYRTGEITAWLLRRMVRTKFANLVNILLQREAIPEFLQAQCTPGKLANALARLASDESARTAQREDCIQALSALKSPSGEAPSQFAARAILDTLTLNPDRNPFESR